MQYASTALSSSVARMMMKVPLAMLELYPVFLPLSTSNLGRRDCHLTPEGFRYTIGLSVGRTEEANMKVEAQFEHEFSGQVLRDVVLSLEAVESSLSGREWRAALRPTRAVSVGASGLREELRMRFVLWELRSGCLRPSKKEWHPACSEATSSYEIRLDPVYAGGRYKSLVFRIGRVLDGAAGYSDGWHEGLVNPDIFDADLRAVVEATGRAIDPFWAYGTVYPIRTSPTPA